MVRGCFLSSLATLEGDLEEREPGQEATLGEAPVQGGSAAVQAGFPAARLQGQEVPVGSGAPGLQGQGAVHQCAQREREEAEALLLASDFRVRSGSSSVSVHGGGQRQEAVARPGGAARGSSRGLELRLLNGGERARFAACGWHEALGKCSHIEARQRGSQGTRRPQHPLPGRGEGRGERAPQRRAGREGGSQKEEGRSWQK